MFSKIAVNIPMLTLLSKVPSYAKFLKEICTNKRKFAEKVQSVATVSALTSFQIPEKLQDKGTFTIPCVIGDKTIPRAFCDPGAGINMLSLKEYQSMEMGPLKLTSVTIQVAERNILHPKGVVEDVLVRVNNFIYPVDFYVVDLSPDLPSCQTDVLLGRPFLRTAKAKIDCSEWSISLDFFGNTTKFDLSDAKDNPSGQYNVNFLNTVKSIDYRANQLDPNHSSEIVFCISSTPSRSTASINSTDVSQGLVTPLEPLPLKSNYVSQPTWVEEDEEVTEKTKGIEGNDETKKGRYREKPSMCRFVLEPTARVDRLNYYQDSGARGIQQKTLQNSLAHLHSHPHHLHHSHSLSGTRSTKPTGFSDLPPHNSTTDMTTSSSSTTSSDDLKPADVFHNLPPDFTPPALQVIYPTIIDLTEDGESAQNTPKTVPAPGIQFTRVELPASVTMDKGKQQLKRSGESPDTIQTKKAKPSPNSPANKVSSATPVVEPGTLPPHPPHPPLKSISEMASYFPYFYFNRAATEEMGQREIVPDYYLDSELLNKMGLNDKIRNFIRVIGWENWLLSNNNTSTYREICIEFYSTLVIDELALKNRNLTTTKAITYRLFGQEIDHSYHSFNQALSFPTTGSTAYPRNWDWDATYGRLTGQAGPMTKEQRKRGKEGMALVQTELRIIHRLLAYNFSGRYYDTHHVSKTERFILESMLVGRKLNFGYWIIKQIWRCKGINCMLFGPLITRLSMQTFFTDIKKTQNALPQPTPLLERARRDGILQRLR